MKQWGETYDWRLSVPNMERRDHYFTRLKWRIELSLKTEGEKVMYCHLSLMYFKCLKMRHPVLCSLMLHGSFPQYQERR